MSPKANFATELALKVGLTMWQRVQYNWGQIVYEHMKMEMEAKKARNPISLIGSTYMSLMGKPFHKVNLTMAPLAMKLPLTPTTTQSTRQKAATSLEKLSKQKTPIGEGKTTR